MTATSAQAPRRKGWRDAIRVDELVSIIFSSSYAPSIDAAQIQLQGWYRRSLPATRCRDYSLCKRHVVFAQQRYNSSIVTGSAIGLWSYSGTAGKMAASAVCPGCCSLAALHLPTSFFSTRTVCIVIVPLPRDASGRTAKNDYGCECGVPCSAALL